MLLAAWAGAAVFALSLAYLVYFYAVILATPAGDAGRPLANGAIDVALFTGFAVHHSVLARSGAKAWLARVVPAGSERTLFVWVASLLLAAVCAWWRSLPGMVYDVHGAWRLPLYAVQAAGALLTIRAAGVIDPRELAGIRQLQTPVTASNASGLYAHEVRATTASGASRPYANEVSALKIVGPFRLVRHPIYLGWMLMVFAAPTMTVNRLVFAIVSSAYLLIAIPWEEKSLIDAHGDAYRSYQHQVRWRVVPHIW